MFKSGYVGIIGSPNVGKSTFLNSIFDSKIAITSDKIGTTRNLIRAIYTDENKQIVFVDTPGIIDARNKLQVYMNNKVDEALINVDIIIYIIDAQIGIRKKENTILEKISKYKNIPKIVCVNKIDLIEQEKAQKIIYDLEQKKIFDDILATSFKNDFNTNSMLKILENFLQEGEKIYTDDQVVDFSLKFYIREIIREKVIRLTYQEIPHGIFISVDEMEEKKRKVYIEATIYVERETHKGMVIGKNAEMLKKIGTYSRQNLETYFDKKVYLKLTVKLNKNWTNKNYDFIETDD